MNICGVIILERGILLHFFRLFVLFASRRDPSPTITPFDDLLWIRCIGHVCGLMAGVVDSAQCIPYQMLTATFVLCS